jgi:hypothetical protein
LIGGGPALKKGRGDPAGESVVFSQAEPSLGLISDDRSMHMAKQKKSAFERLSSGAMNRRQRRDLARRLAGNDRWANDCAFERRWY